MPVCLSFKSPFWLHYLLAVSSRVEPLSTSKQCVSPIHSPISFCLSFVLFATFVSHNLMHFIHITSQPYFASRRTSLTNCWHATPSNSRSKWERSRGLKLAPTSTLDKCLELLTGILRVTVLGAPPLHWTFQFQCPYMVSVMKHTFLWLELTNVGQMKARQC